MSRMIVGFTPEHELIGFFEVEPAILDLGVPWVYNTLTFETERHDVHVNCTITPSYGRLRVRLTRGGHDFLDADIGHIVSLHLESRADRETMRAMVAGPQHGENSFVLLLSVCPKTS